MKADQGVWANWKKAPPKSGTAGAAGACGCDWESKPDQNANGFMKGISDAGAGFGLAGCGISRSLAC